MSAHVATVKDIYARFASGDVPGILERLDPEIEWEHDWGAIPPALFAPGRGLERVAAFFTALRDYDFTRFEPLAFLSDDRRVAAEIAFAFTHIPTGSRVSDLEIHLWTFGETGLPIRFRHFIDPRPFA